MTILKSAAFATLALLTLTGASPSLAEYYLQGNSGYQGYPGYDTDEYPQPGWRRHRPRYEEDPYYQPRAQIGYSCWTKRGTCDLTDGRPVNSGCRCYIPGFGPKRGYVQP